MVAGAAARRGIRDPFLPADCDVVRKALNCFRAICNNAEGLAAFVAEPLALDALAGCLDASPIARAAAHGPALDILCVAVWASNDARKAVVEALGRLATRRMERPFVWAAALIKTTPAVADKAKALALRGDRAESFPFAAAERPRRARRLEESFPFPRNVHLVAAAPLRPASRNPSRSRGTSASSRPRRRRDPLRGILPVPKRPSSRPRRRRDHASTLIHPFKRRRRENHRKTIRRRLADAGATN